MDKQTTLDTLYLVKISDKDIFLEIAIGDKGQTSLTTVDVDGSVLVKEHAGNLDKKSLGSNAALAGKRLGIAATITDTSRETDMTSIEIRLSGGFMPRKYFLAKKVAEEGASADYVCIIEFFLPKP